MKRQFKQNQFLFQIFRLIEANFFSTATGRSELAARKMVPGITENELTFFDCVAALPMKIATATAQCWHVGQVLLALGKETLQRQPGRFGNTDGQGFAFWKDEQEMRRRRNARPMKKKEAGFAAGLRSVCGNDNQSPALSGGTARVI